MNVSRQESLMHSTNQYYSSMARHPSGGTLKVRNAIHFKVCFTITFNIVNLLHVTKLLISGFGT